MMTNSFKAEMHTFHGQSQQGLQVHYTVRCEVTELRVVQPSLSTGLLCEALAFVCVHRMWNIVGEQGTPKKIPLCKGFSAGFCAQT